MNRLLEWLGKVFAPRVTTTTYIAGDAKETPEEFSRAFERMEEAFEEMEKGFRKLK